MNLQSVKCKESCVSGRLDGRDVPLDLNGEVAGELLPVMGMCTLTPSVIDRYGSFAEHSSMAV